MQIDIEYSLSEIFSILLSKLWLILLCILIGTAGSFIISKYVIEEEYTASVSMYVAPNKESTDLRASISELNYAQEVVDTYIEILKTNSFFTEVSKTTGLDYTSANLKKMIEMKRINNTEIFQIQVVSNNPQHSLKIANTIASLAPKKIIEIKDADAVRVVDPATLPIHPTAPNVMLNTAIGFLSGAVFSVLLVLLLDMLDKRIKDEDDIIKHYNIPILGAVPSFDSKGKVY